MNQVVRRGAVGHKAQTNQGAYGQGPITHDGESEVSPAPEEGISDGEQFLPRTYKKQVCARCALHRRQGGCSITGLLVHSIGRGLEANVYRLVGISSVLRWSLLIVTYGTFIPNTWRRCAVVACSLASVPIVVMVTASVMDEVARPHMMAALPETSIILATASAIAAFGSHKIRELHEKAHEAEKIGPYQLKQVIGFSGE